MGLESGQVGLSADGNCARWSCGQWEKCLFVAAAAVAALREEEAESNERFSRWSGCQEDRGGEGSDDRQAGMCSWWGRQGRVGRGEGRGGRRRDDRNTTTGGGPQVAAVAGARRQAAGALPATP